MLCSLRHPLHQQSDTAFLLNTLGNLWVAEKKIDWPEVYAHEQRWRTTLPTYPFERSRYWIDFNRQALEADARQSPPAERGLGELKQAVKARGEDSTPEQSSAEAAPTNQIEQTIAGIWQELFGVERVGVNDNFFELGGNSLLGIQLMSRMRKVFMVEIPMNSLFESPTVTGLANVVSEIHLKEKGAEELEQMIAEIESLSAQDVELRLNQ